MWWPFFEFPNLWSLFFWRASPRTWIATSLFLRMFFPTDQHIDLSLIYHDLSLFKKKHFFSTSNQQPVALPPLSGSSCQEYKFVELLSLRFDASPEEVLFFIKSQVVDVKDSDFQTCYDVFSSLFYWIVFGCVLLHSCKWCKCSYLFSPGFF